MAKVLDFSIFRQSPFAKYIFERGWAPIIHGQGACFNLFKQSLYTKYLHFLAGWTPIDHGQGACSNLIRQSLYTKYRTFLRGVDSHEPWQRPRFLFQSLRQSLYTKYIAKRGGLT
jgi:hypothetical protein